jgi:hypothetical protein
MIARRVVARYVAANDTQFGLSPSEWTAAADTAADWFVQMARDNMDADYARTLVFELHDPRVWKQYWSTWVYDALRLVDPSVKVPDEYTAVGRSYLKSVLVVLDKLQRTRFAAFVSGRPMSAATAAGLGLPAFAAVAARVKEAARAWLSTHEGYLAEFAETDALDTVDSMRANDAQSEIEASTSLTFPDFDAFWEAFKPTLLAALRRRLAHWLR